MSCLNNIKETVKENHLNSYYPGNNSWFFFQRICLSGTLYLITSNNFFPHLISKRTTFNGHMCSGYRWNQMTHVVHLLWFRLFSSSTTNTGCISLSQGIPCSLRTFNSTLGLYLPGISGTPVITTPNVSRHSQMSPESGDLVKLSQPRVSYCCFLVWEIPVDESKIPWSRQEGRKWLLEAWASASEEDVAVFLYPLSEATHFCQNQDRITSLRGRCISQHLCGS